MNQSHQNLARSWRPKQFQEVVGQPLPVRMLQNSLYTNHFFPVYLFAGQRGCGKTTTARIFSAALNCAKLADFQKNPKQQVPCDVCPSCQMMQQGKHPDFIEIDAASHTGVDNVRAIVDAASFMPLVGGKRVYLIDEAHMLSKAAFNAFLKILEEPPASVLFILATTDPHKIIDTVRSRCFQLFFDAVAMDAIVAHLKNVCTQEEISHDDAGLMAIVANSEGSVRDALNVLEQVRFSAPSVTKKAVLAILGHVDEEHINNLFCALLKADAHQLQKILGEINFSLIAPEPLWYSICLLARSAMWQALGVQDVKISEAVERLLAEVTSSRIKLVFEMVCSYEMPLKKTTKKHLLLEMLFLRLCSDTFSHDASPSSGQKESIGIRSTTEKKSSAAVNQSVSPVHERSGSRKPLHDGAQELQEKSAPVVEEIVVRSQVPSDMVDTWKNFLIAIRAADDNFLVSIFEQAEFRFFDAAKKQISIAYAAPSSFFDEHRQEKKQVWQSIVEKIFGRGVTLSIEYDATIVKNSTASKKKSFEKVTVQKQPEIKANAVDVSDKDQWAATHLLLDNFGGTVKVIEDENE